MIARSLLVPIGTFLKTHGIKGELNATLETEGIDLSTLRCILIERDGLMVPFFVASQRRRGSQGVLVILDGIKNQQAAAAFAGKTIYAIGAELPQNDGEDDGYNQGFYLSDLCGYSVTADGIQIGVVDDFDDTTANVLMNVRDSSGVIRSIPVADEFFYQIDPDTRTIQLSLPGGLLEL